MKLLPYQVYGMWRPGGHYGVYGTPCKVFLQRFYAWLHPTYARVRNKQICPYPKAQALLEGFFAA